MADQNLSPGMTNKATHGDVDIILRLYQMRCEPVMREARKDGAVERERRQQARERWAERGGEAREQQHDRGRHDEPRRDVPPRPPCGASAFRISRHEDERHDCSPL